MQVLASQRLFPVRSPQQEDETFIAETEIAVIGGSPN
jgi:hypothetical protein